MDPIPELTDAERERYARQLALPEIGPEGQARLKKSRVLIVGAGGLGSPAALYLAAAGVGAMGVIDADRVDASNMQRQILHGDADVGKLKADSAMETLKSINPWVAITTHAERLDASNAPEYIESYDLVLGCVDNFTTRYAINAACVELEKVNVYGSISMFQGQASVFAPGGPCYRCFFQDPPPEDWRPSPRENGIVGTIPGIIGCIQAHEAIKALLGIGKTLAGRLLLFDGLAMSFREITLKKDPLCPVCGRKEVPL